MPLSVFLCWLLLVWSAGWLASPVALRLTGHALPDGGLALGRIGFLVFWSVLAFWLGRAGVSVALCAWLYPVLAVACLAFGLGERAFVRREWKSRRRALLSVEAAFLATFLVFWTLRGFWSDTSGSNGEKGMDSALVATLSRAGRLPPPNPYAAGARLESYYILGHLEAALLTRASGTTTRWSYNLMCATLPALCVPALFALGFGLTRKQSGGAFVAFAVLGLGTLQPLYQWTHPDNFSPTRFLRLDPMAVSRVIPYTINEFPWFTFNHGDLHAHFFDFPIEIALMTFAWALYRAREARRLRLLGFCSVFLGAQILTNTWDFPAFAFLIGLSFVLAPRTPSGDSFELGRALKPANPTRNGDGQPTTASPKRARSLASESPKVAPEPATSASPGANSPAKKSKKGAAQPAIASRQLATASPQPATAPPQPTTASRQPATASRQPATASRQPVPVAGERTQSSAASSDGALWPRRVLWLLLALGGAIGLSLPYLLGINTAAREPGSLSQPASPLREWLLLWAPIATAWAAFGAARFQSKPRAWLVLGGLSAFVLFAAWRGQNSWGYPTGSDAQPAPTPESLTVWFTALNPARLVIPLLGGNAWLALRGLKRERGALRFAAMLALAGLFALSWSETTWAGFLGDARSPVFSDFKRQDTTFKFGLQAWFLWGTAAGAGTYLTLRRWPLALRLALVPFLLVMAISSLVDTVARTRGFDPALRQKWDGWAHLARPEQEAARWLETHTPPDQNILEAEQKEGGDYTVYTRYANATGIPTIIGPQAHSFQWSPAPTHLVRRTGESADDFLGRHVAQQFGEVFKRKDDARTAFTSPDAARRSDILKRYGVRFVVWGELERAQYSETSRALLERDLQLAASFGFDASDDPAHRVEIWRVP